MQWKHHRVILVAAAPGSDSGLEPLNSRLLACSVGQTSTTSTSTVHGGTSILGYFPIDILQDIFLLCLPFKKDQAPSRRDAPYLLTYVCRAWYKVVIGLRQMWSTIILSAMDVPDLSPTQRQAGINHLKLCSSRSRDIAIKLYVRADFFANPVFYDHVRRVSQQISHLSITYPAPLMVSYEHTPFFPPSPSLDLHNLENFEIQNRRAFTRISYSDFSHLHHIIQSSTSLKRNIVWVMSLTPKLCISPNLSNLQVLTLFGGHPISTCFYLLQNAPTLEKLSIRVMSEQGVASQMNGEHLIRPFIHRRIRNLAISHQRTDISPFLENATLPSLQFLVVDRTPSKSRPVFSWSQSQFLSFLRRSNCWLKCFQILDQEILPSQLLEVLRLPNISRSLQCLGIQSYDATQMVVDDDLLEKLTLSETLGGTLGTNGKEGVPPARTLCPNLERLILFVPLRFSLSKLLSMFESRLHSDSSCDGMFPFKTLKHVEMDVYDEMKPSLDSLEKRGLVFTLFEPLLATPMPPNDRQQLLWQHYLARGLDDEVYDHDTGTWRPADLTFVVS
ncbi:hypothetical protein D9756_003482 [Leucocoprinus leucothites]|uniref:F-box domain-containing protein n=1 Tax=Leucocoprinus leucothites TaxID=201217 RepID=A0A8H5LJ91_9AGAR|nr:hypothetical protein D9756_003482 [Leucoagaricus leucothites]